jgi:hypothetical protein
LLGRGGLLQVAAHLQLLKGTKQATLLVKHDMMSSIDFLHPFHQRTLQFADGIHGIVVVEQILVRNVPFNS